LEAAGLLGFAVGAVAAAEAAILRQLEAVGVVLLVFLGIVIAPLTLLTGQDDHDAVLFFCHLRILGLMPT
jgi:hypothetical protein